MSAVQSGKESRSIKKRAASAGIEETSVGVHLLQYVREKLGAMKKEPGPQIFTSSPLFLRRKFRVPKEQIAPGPAARKKPVPIARARTV